MLDAGLAIGGLDATLDDYRRHLCMLRAWLGPLEAWLARFDDGPQAMAPVSRLGAIEADLALIDGRCVARGQAAWPDGASAAYRWGVCYVVEGSQLGGAVLYQRLAARLAPHPLGYLRGREEGPGPRWRAFMLALKEGVSTEDEIAQACAGACDAFDRILALRE
jgi:heme oxygenase